jgi:hypothetical protein
MAGQGKVFHLVTAAVLPGNDMFHMEREERLIFLAEPAILTLLSRPLSDELARRGIHQVPG